MPDLRMEQQEICVGDHFSIAIQPDQVPVIRAEVMCSEAVTVVNLLRYGCPCVQVVSFEGSESKNFRKEQVDNLELALAAIALPDEFFAAQQAVFERDLKTFVVNVQRTVK